MDAIESLFDHEAPEQLQPGAHLEQEDDLHSLAHSLTPSLTHSHGTSMPSQEMLQSLFRNNDELDLSGTSQEELRLRASLLHSEEFGIRDSVKAQVEDVRWLREVTSEGTSKGVSEAESGSGGGSEGAAVRCAVCTLPVGTCPHTDVWMDTSLRKLQHTSTDDALQSEINSVLGLLDTGGALQIQTTHQHGDIDLDTIRWALHTPRLADKIGDTLLPLSLPTERGWHSITQVGKYTLLFGGVRFKNHRSPEPFGSVIPPTDVEYLNDLFIYDSENVSWHKVNILESTAGEGINWPCGRYGHTTCGIDKYHMMLFGGRTHGGRYLSDTWIFSLLLMSWRRLHAKDLSAIPEPRAFTACALAPSTRSIFLYGGTNGIVNFGDVWVFQWGGRSFSTKPWEEWQQEQRELASPTKLTVEQRQQKAEEEAARQLHQKLNSGFNGDIHEDNPLAMGSLGAHSGEIYWSRAVMVSGGGVPEARYGHRMVSIQEGSGDGGHSANGMYGGYDELGMYQETRTTRLRNGTFLAVIGGCCVSPQEELAAKQSRGDNILPKDKISNLLHLAQRLQAQYSLEGDMSDNAGNELLEQLGRIERSAGLQLPSHSAIMEAGIFNLKAVHHRAAQVTGMLAAMEKETRALEAELASSWYDAQAAALNTSKKGARQSAELGVHFLCADDVAWVPQINPRFSGLTPCSRMHFGAVALGDFIFVIGGVLPSALTYTSAVRDRLIIHALNVKTLVWTEPKSMETADYLEGPIRVAEKDIVRAVQRVELEKSRGLSMGAREGITVEVMEAEAVLNVCRWRKKMLQQEQKGLMKAPLACFGMDGCVIGAAGNDNGFGNRAIFHGGWNFGDHWGGINHQKLQFGSHANLSCKEAVNCCIILDLEQEMERRRRLEEEFHAKLERDRLENERINFQQQIQSLFELREVKRKEVLQQAYELKKMAIEDYLSSLPPLSLPPSVKLAKANETTLWLRWARVYRNSYGKPIDPKTVTYSVYMAGGFDTINLGDRVLCTPPPKVTAAPQLTARDEERNAMFSEPSESGNDSDSDVSPMGSPRSSKQVQSFKGEIIGVQRGKGLFTVKGDIGFMGRDIPRSCLTLLRTEEIVEDKLAKLNLKRKGPPKKEPVISKRHRSYQKAQAVARLQEEANAAAAKSLGNQMDLKWKLIYEGNDTEYVVENIVPQHIIETEKGTTCKVQFCLRTVGADFPLESYSLMSPVTEFSTKWNNASLSGERTRISRAKKEIIATSLPGHGEIQMQKWNGIVYSEGIADAYV